MSLSSVLVLLSIAILLPVAGASWFLFHLFVQQGRLLLRLENLEKRLQQVELGPEPNTVGSRGGLPAGTMLPDFPLTLLSGGSASLSAYRGHNVLLIFFNPHCCYSLTLAPDLQRIESRRLMQDPIPVVITSGDLIENRRLFGGFPIAANVLVQEGFEIATLYRVRGTPMGYLLDEGCRIQSELLVGPEILRLTLAIARDA